MITAFVRITFLAKVTNYGDALRIDEPMIRLFRSELKADIKRQFEFTKNYFTKTSEAFGVKNVPNKLKIFTQTEYAGCKMQAQLLYLDREMYPYGVQNSF